jgi:hypothetical protein
MKTLCMLLVVLAGIFPQGGLEAQETGDAQPDRPSVRRLGVGISVSRFSPDFSGLGRAYTDAEDQYRSQGYSITPYAPAFEVAQLVTLSLQFRPSIPIGVLLEAGTSLDSRNVDFKAVSVSVLYFPPVGWRAVEPYVGAGIGQYRFSAARDYGEGNRISPDDGTGVYTYLDRIESNGGGVGSPLTIGLDLHSPSSATTLSGFVSYLVMLRSVEGEIPNGRGTKLNLNSLMVGARLMVGL